MVGVSDNLRYARKEGEARLCVTQPRLFLADCYHQFPLAEGGAKANE